MSVGSEPESVGLTLSVSVAGLVAVSVAGLAAGLAAVSVAGLVASVSVQSLEMQSWLKLQTFVKLHVFFCGFGGGNWSGCWFCRPNKIKSTNICLQLNLDLKAVSICFKFFSAMNFSIAVVTAIQLLSFSLYAMTAFWSFLDKSNASVVEKPTCCMEFIIHSLPGYSFQSKLWSRQNP